MNENKTARKLSLHELPENEKSVVAIAIVRNGWTPQNQGGLDGFHKDIRQIELVWDYMAQKWTLTLRDKGRNIIGWDYPKPFDSYNEAIAEARDLYTRLRKNLDDGDNNGWARHTGPQLPLHPNLQR